MIYLFYRKKNLEVFSLNIPLYIKFIVHWPLSRLGARSLRGTLLPNVTPYRSLTTLKFWKKSEAEHSGVMGDRRCCFVVSYVFDPAKLYRSQQTVICEYLQGPYLSSQ